MKQVLRDLFSDVDPRHRLSQCPQSFHIPLASRQTGCTHIHMHKEDSNVRMTGEHTYGEHQVTV